MQTRKKNDRYKLIQFNYDDYFTSGIDQVSKNKLPFVTLRSAGIELVSQYYADKYQLPNVLAISSVEQFLQVYHSKAFKKIRESENNIRIPFMLTVQLDVQLDIHSTPIVYVKEQNQEALLVFDSIDDYRALQIAKEVKIKVYTTSETRQRDNYSCHTDGLVVLRELAGRDQFGHFLIPDILTKLEKQPRITQQTSSLKNLNKIHLFDKLLIPIQHKPFLDNQSADKNATIQAFLKKYPPDEVMSGERPAVSSYLREKGLKYAHIIEIQFYLNQLKQLLGKNFTDSDKKKFIEAAKIVFKRHGQLSFLHEAGKKSLYDLAQQLIHDLRDLQHVTALHEAASSGNVNIISLLFKRADIDVNRKTGPQQETALHMAVSKGHKQVVALLRAYPTIDVNCQTADGKTPLDIAREKGYADIVELLLAHPLINNDKQGSSATIKI